jgi:hypothetical protein
MTTIEILLQGEAIHEIELVVLAVGAGADEVLAAAGKLRAPGHDGQYLVFLQDDDTPLRHGRPLPQPSSGGPLCLHVHRSAKIKVEVRYNGSVKTVELAPSRTVGAVKVLAAEKLYGMDRHDAAEHVLQVAGSNERPDADTHIGSLAHHCEVVFDLVPLVRVEGEK